MRLLCLSGIFLALLSAVVGQGAQLATTTTFPLTTLAVEAQDYDVEAVISEDALQGNQQVVLNSVAGQNVAIGGGNVANQNKKIPGLLQKLTNNKLVKPLSDAINSKVTRITNYFNHPNSPGFGGLQALNPANIWQKINKKGGLLSGSNAAIFGLSLSPKPDYPFAYRNGRSWREELKKYDKENAKKPFTYQHLVEITRIKNNTYKFNFFDQKNDGILTIFKDRPQNLTTLPPIEDLQNNTVSDSFVTTQISVTTNEENDVLVTTFD